MIMKMMRKKWLWYRKKWLQVMYWYILLVCVGGFFMIDFMWICFYVLVFTFSFFFFSFSFALFFFLNFFFSIIISFISATEIGLCLVTSLDVAFIDWCVYNVLHNPNYALRATFFYAIGLISRNQKGVRQLSRCVCAYICIYICRRMDWCVYTYEHICVYL